MAALLLFFSFTAPPILELDMLTVFVPLPVVLAAKPLRAVCMGASVRFLMPFLVFPGSRISFPNLG
jgi:hypothetical protein